MSKWDAELSEFYRQSVECLCGTLHLEKSLKNFFDLLLSYVPVRQLSLGRSRFEVRGMEGLATCSERGMEFFQPNLAQLPSSLSSNDITLLKDLDAPDGILIRDARNPLAQLLTTDTKDVPLFFLRMRHEDSIIGGAVFHCRLDHPFTERDLEFLRVLRTPLFAALNTYFQYTEMRELKEQIWQENLRLRQQLNGVPTVEVVGASGGLAEVMNRVRQAGPVDIPVLITGETGTGKELVAQAIHTQSSRHNKPFVAVNCGGIPPTLIDSELFGHVRGAFTGATANHKGRFERAQGGTIFLDEIAELPLDMQARLLRVLQEGAVERVGGSTPVPVNFRLLAATNRDLLTMVKAGKFREDLYYRLKVVSISLPPLRERKQDLPLLVDYLIKQAALRFGITPPPLALGEMGRLAECDWPGNVRELRNVVEEALVFMPEGPLHFRLPHSRASVTYEARACAPASALASLSPNATGSTPENCPPLMSDYVADYCRHLLHLSGGRIGGPGGAAAMAGVNANTLRSRLDRLGVLYQRTGQEK